MKLKEACAIPWLLCTYCFHKMNRQGRYNDPPCVRMIQISASCLPHKPILLSLLVLQLTHFLFFHPELKQKLTMFSLQFLSVAGALLLGAQAQIFCRDAKHRLGLTK